MKGVNGSGPATGKFGRGAPKDSGLGSVGVDDVWLVLAAGALFGCSAP